MEVSYKAGRYVTCLRTYMSHVITTHISLHTEFHVCMLGRVLDGYHGALEDAGGLYSTHTCLGPARYEWGRKNLAVSLAFMLHRIYNNARSYAAKREGYSRYPYGKSFPVCKGHNYACTMCTSHSKRNPGRKFFCCNCAFISKNPLVGNQQCNTFFWVDKLK